MGGSHSNCHHRYRAVSEAGSRVARQVPALANRTRDSQPVSAIFGEDTFNRKVMEERLPRDVYKALLDSIRNGSKLDPDVADSVAHAMKEWAIDRGATHFCHWFQPQTGMTAEKHDAFLTMPDLDTHLERFSGSQLIQGEPDASSFPSGGMRSTFEARGYTAWDISSPTFLMTGPNGKTLCIPSVFISYNGQALDLKTPLLRSMAAINKQALRILRIFSNETAKRVVPTAGPEQEYFLIDRAFYHLRPDLVMCHRTLIGAKPAKGQELEDHYFGRIRGRVMAFMQEAEDAIYRLGIPAKTRHNEVAPSQCEIAPIFEEANIASDHNQLVLLILKQMARRHGFNFITHEKPFEGINGSGKHVNWSLMDSDGCNLLEPGNTPRQNLQFLVFLCGVLKAVHRRSGLLRASIASAGNDHRLGANEAPPAIMSIFLGEQLNRILNEIESGESKADSTAKRIIELGLASVPVVSQDNTDRNRTSPFAFTGNKFEFRACGSSQPISTPLTFINGAMTEALDELGTAIEQKVRDGATLESAVIDVIKAAVIETRSIRFEGNNYGLDWIEEAARRGLPNLRKTPEALTTLIEESNVACLDKYGIQTPEEMHARYHISLERYVKDLDIEVETLSDMVKTMVVPSAIRYLSELLEVTSQINKESTAACKTITKITASLATTIDQLEEQADCLRALKKELSGLDLDDQARRYADEIVPAIRAVRVSADWIEENVSDDLWPLPKYREMLFVQ